MKRKFREAIFYFLGYGNKIIFVIHYGFKMFENIFLVLLFVFQNISEGPRA